MENISEFLKKLKTERPYDPETLLLSMYLEKNMVRKDTCTPMVNAALFIIAKTWKQLQLSTSRGMDKEDVVHIYNRILLSHYKEWNNAICSNRNGPRDCCTEWSESEKEKYVWYCLYAKEILQMNLQNRKTQRLNLWLGDGGGIHWEFGIDTYTLLYLK